MGASGMGGGGKSANVELNLVPLIDLLSTLICFLLLTAAWGSQLDTVSSNAPPKASAEMPETPQPTPDPNEKKKVSLTVSLEIDKIELLEDAKTQTILHQSGEPNLTQLIQQLKDWKARYPDRSDVVLATDNKAKYKHLILMMDTLKAENFPEIGVNLN